MLNVVHATYLKHVQVTIGVSLIKKTSTCMCPLKPPLLTFTPEAQQIVTVEAFWHETKPRQFVCCNTDVTTSIDQ